MKLSEIISKIDVIRMTADPDMEINGISYDSRSTAPGDMFVAVTGYESDGHRYIGAAVERGAVCVLCEREPETDIPYVLVENTRRGLALASKNYFRDPTSSMKLVGVTGTNGKTTTTTLIKTIIEKTLGAKVGLIGTNGNMIGDAFLPTERTTPESYELYKLFREMADAGCGYAVMEVSSHALYLDRVCGLTFEVGVFSNLTQDHLDFHKTMDAYAEAKAILFTKCRHGVINIDDPYAHVMLNAATCPVMTYSVDDDGADLVAKRLRMHADSVEFCALTTGNIEAIRLGIPGRFSVYNGLAAYGACISLGIAPSDVAAALNECHGVKGRAEVVPTGRDFTILIDYAHTPDALENIITTVKEVAKGRTVTLFGCGGDRDRTKRPIMGRIASELSDFVIVTSDNPRTEEPGAIISDILEGMKDTQTPYVVIENRRDAIAWAIHNARKDDVIILAGKGHETYQILGKKKIHFDEREAVAEILAE